MFDVGCDGTLFRHRTFHAAFGRVLSPVSARHSMMDNATWRLIVLAVALSAVILTVALLFGDRLQQPQQQPPDVATAPPYAADAAAADDMTVQQGATHPGPDTQLQHAQPLEQPPPVVPQPPAAPASVDTEPPTWAVQDQNTGTRGGLGQPQAQAKAAAPAPAAPAPAAPAPAAATAAAAGSSGSGSGSTPYQEMPYNDWQSTVVAREKKLRPCPTNVALKGSLVLSRAYNFAPLLPVDYWIPHCTIPTPDQAKLQRCLDDKWVAFIGDSSSLDLAMAFTALLTNDARPREGIRLNRVDDITNFVYKPGHGGTRVSFMHRARMARSPFPRPGASEQDDLHDAFFKSWGKSKHRPDLVVMSIGAGELLTGTGDLVPDSALSMQQFKKDVKKLTSLVQSAGINQRNTLWWKPHDLAPKPHFTKSRFGKEAYPKYHSMYLDMMEHAAEAMRAQGMTVMDLYEPTAQANAAGLGLHDSDRGYGYPDMSDILSAITAHYVCGVASRMK